MKKRIIKSVLLALSAFFIFSSPVLAVPSDISPTTFTAKPSAKSVVLKWTKATGSTNTIIRYMTSAFPTSETGADGSILVYSGTSNTYTQTDLTPPPATSTGALVPGTNYYYSAWGFDGVNYSATEANLLITTLADIDAGGSVPLPTITTDFFNLQPTSKTWFDNLQPFSGFVKSFADDWGMPEDNMQFTIGILILLFCGVMSYIKVKSPALSMGINFMVCMILIMMHLLPPYTIGIVIALGLGVWAIEAFAMS